MKKISLTTWAILLLMVVGSFAVCKSTYAAESFTALSVKLKHVKSVTAITEVFGEGQKTTAVAIEYDKNINTAKLAKSSFAVKDRTIAKVYANTVAAKATKGVNGQYVIIELNPSDQAAATFLPNGMSFIRKKTAVAVTQLGNIITMDGAKYRPSKNAMVNDKTINLVVDDFKQFEYKDPQTGKTVKYNLFMPKNYDKNKSYPMVLFIHDMGVCSTETDVTLIQGLGAVVWATPSEQAKHPCFVLAPQFASTTVTDGNKYTTDLDATVNLIHTLEDQYNIDKDRIYATGQSMGCMSSIVMNIKYPDLFAASFLVAGQWDPAAVAPLAKDKLWIVVSEGDARAFPGMNAITAALEKDGAKISQETWNGRANAAEFEADVKKMLGEGNSINYTVLQKGTVVTPGLKDDPGSNHICTWRIAYTIEGIRDWLFTQVKSAEK